MPSAQRLFRIGMPRPELAQGFQGNDSHGERVVPYWDSGKPEATRVRPRVVSQARPLLIQVLTRKLLTDTKAQANWRARIQLAASYALPPEEFMRRNYDKQTWPLPALYLLHLDGIRKLPLT